MTLFHNLDIVEAVKNNRIHTLFQPILECKSLEVYGHEALSRATDDKGQPILLSRLFDVSKKLDMMYNLDRQCRLACITNAAKQTAFRGKLFINFIPTVIYDPNVCLRTTHEAV
ncbi:EAL domain-containing protein, partial [Aduncisulcus paluster]